MGIHKSEGYLDEMMTQWNVLDLPNTLSGPLIKSLRKTPNLYDRFAAWNKEVLRNN